MAKAKAKSKAKVKAYKPRFDGSYPGFHGSGVHAVIDCNTGHFWRLDVEQGTIRPVKLLTTPLPVRQSK